MPRALFEKLDDAIYISHLDLMRLFQRAFKRAGLPLTHTQGFNQRPSVSIALPLSLGVESVCELLDFQLEGGEVACADICARLNDALIGGVHVRQVYDSGRKLRELALLDCRLDLEYDCGVPAEAVGGITELFRRDCLPVEKKSKTGVTEQDLLPMVRHIAVAQTTPTEVAITARICAQNPTLNPAQLLAAVRRYLPEMQPDFCRFRRLEVYDTEEAIFR